MISFEFDRKKSLDNLNKHGIDFVDAQALWYDPDLIEVKANSIGRVDRGNFPPQPLAEPDVKVSPHTAPIKDRYLCQCANSFESLYDFVFVE